MTSTNRPARPSSYVGSYGRAWVAGVIADDVARFIDAGGTVRLTASGRMVAVDEAGYAVPVVCGDVVLIPTEDGPIDGRCGGLVDEDGYACQGHAAERRGWLAASEAERLDWERRHDAELYG